jgi:hypothetical protein
MDGVLKIIVKDGANQLWPEGYCKAPFIDTHYREEYLDPNRIVFTLLGLYASQVGRVAQMSHHRWILDEHPVALNKQKS